MHWKNIIDVMSFFTWMFYVFQATAQRSEFSILIIDSKQQHKLRKIKTTRREGAHLVVLAKKAN